MQVFWLKKYFFCKKVQNTGSMRSFFFDLSDHEIVGGCSTLLAKSNKKMHFSRPDYRLNCLMSFDIV